jgi:hypothetical protein
MLTVGAVSLLCVLLLVSHERTATGQETLGWWRGRATDVAGIRCGEAFWRLKLFSAEIFLMGKKALFSTRSGCVPEERFTTNVAVV